MTLSERIQTARNSKSFRLWLMVILFAILLYMYFFVGKMKVLLIVLMVLLAGAIGVEVADYDVDLGRLRDTWGNIQESRVQTKNGVKIFGNCVSNNLNCANFSSQRDAQAKYDNCAEQIRVDNNKSDKNEIKNLDIYGLDKDKDGIVCESLPKIDN
jgi:hypothetical protein